METGKKYLMTLTPVGNFCFGKESIHVNRLKEKKDKDGNTDSFFYFSESMRMPQQTALLGMLRYALLSIADKAVFANNKIQDKGKARELIGPQSFTKGQNNSFGKIKSIGACGLRIKYKDENIWHPLQFAPMDYKLTVKLANSNSCKTLLSKENAGIVVIDNYKAKDGLNNELLLVIGDDGKIIKEYKWENIFKEVVQVGINRNITTGHVENNSYYKQQFYRLADSAGNEKFEVQFCFNTELDDSINIDGLRGLSVQLGSDDSRFILNWEETEEGSRDLQPVYKKSDPTVSAPSVFKLTLMSDSYLKPEEVEESSIFNISDIKPFRSLSTTVNTTDYYNRGNNSNGGVQKSERSYLYVRGSVFFFDEEKKRQAFANLLKDVHQEFYKIGYNHYIL